MLNAFDSLKSNIVNKTSFATAEKMGLPTFKDELWKYTRAKKFLSEDYSLYSNEDAKEVSELVKAYSDANLLVFLNGKYLSSVSVVKDEDLKLEAANDKREGEFTHFFSAMNSAFSNEGVTVSVGKNKKLNFPVRVLYVSTKSSKEVYAPLASKFELETGAEAVVVEEFVSLEENANFTSLRNKFSVGANGVLKHYVIQRDSMSSKVLSDTSVDVHADARYEEYVLSLGASISRFDLEVNMKESGSESIFDCFYGVQDKQHTDHHTKVNHLVAHTSSKQLYKGILDDSARAVFNGKVIIVKDAQKTDAEQLNKNLMLSDKSEIDTKPEMMIDADDVKCAHGAAIGQMNEDEVFYLKSRAISDKDARALLSRGYALETLSRVSDENLKKEMAQLIRQYLEN